MDTPTRQNFLPFSRPVLEEAEIEAVAGALRSGWLTTGPKTAEFETRFAAFVGAPHALGLSSCTAGLFLGLKLSGVGPGDEVVVPPLTFAASANVAVHCGARVVFADVNPETGNLDPAALEAAITSRTRAVVPVHLYGRPADAEAIRDIAARRGIAVIADCAHATESRIGTRHVADFADAAAFSFYATKNLAVGEGGMLTTTRADWNERARRLALHGMSQGAYARYSAAGSPLYDVVEPGYKFNMTDPDAALGLAQLERLEGRLKRREEIWKRYDEAFSGLPLLTPPAVAAGITHARHLYTLRAPDGLDRAAVLSKIHAAKIGVSVHFTAVHLFSYYRAQGWRRGDFPNAERISDSTFSIPLTPYLAEADIDDVIAAVRAAVE
jgi:dTDP-4-amino-4,6-dideoxygalactose transaminase